MNIKTDSQGETLAKERVVLALFRLYRSMDGKASRALTDAYRDAIADFSATAAQQAFERFRDDEVSGADPDFMPSVVRWRAQVRMLDQLLNRVTVADGLISYRIGELPPDGYEPLGPTKLELDGRVRDVSHLTLAEKETAIRTGHMPADRPQLQKASGE